MKKFILPASFILTVLLIIAVFQPVFSKSNFDYSVYTPDTFQRATVDTPKFEDGAHVLFIVDFSNSMNDKMGQKTKLQVALETLTVILPKIPPSVKTGLRVYGHRAGFTYLQGCMASKLAVPFGERNADRILGALYGTKAVGWTPITYSLKQAVNVDFAGIKGKKHIVLLTDGGENCDESPCTYAIELMKVNDDISIDVVAFDIYDMEANDQLRCTAVTTRGKFFSANTPRELMDSLFESLNIDKNVKGTIKVDEN